VPEDVIVEELPPMRVAEVRGCVEKIAQVAGCDAEALQETATETARSDSVRSKFKAEEVEAKIDGMLRERILPSDDAMQKVARYEAHLSRQLYQALHELEALQTRRLGGNAPLARLDVQGLPKS
jgi:hypothetical protein